MSLAEYVPTAWTDYADSPDLQAVNLNHIELGIEAVTDELIAFEAWAAANYQPISAELTGIASLSSPGYVQRTGPGTYVSVASIPQADVAGLTSSLASKANATDLANYLLLTGGIMSGQIVSTRNGYHPSVAALRLQSLQPTIVLQATSNAIDSKTWLITGSDYWLDNELNILSSDDAFTNYLPGISLRRASGSNSVAVRLSHVGGAVYAKPLGAGFVRSASDGLLSSAAIASGDLPATIASNTTGTAARWTTSRSISMTGDVTWSTSIDGSANATAAATIAAGAVTLAKLATVPANTILGNNTGSTATPIALTVSQAQTLLGLPAGGWTLQSAYNASTAPQVTTSLSKGAIVFRNGTGTDPASVLEVRAASGTPVFTVGGTGDVMLNGRLIQGGVTERLSASGDLSVASITSSALGAGFVRSSAGGLLSSAALASGDVTGALGYTPLQPSNVSGTSGQVAQFTGANTVSSDVGLSTLKTSGITRSLSVGNPAGTTQPAYLNLYASSGFTAAVAAYANNVERVTFGMATTAGRFFVRMTNGSGVTIDDPLTIDNASGGTIALGGSTNRPITHTGTLALTTVGLLARTATDNTAYFALYHNSLSASSTNFAFKARNDGLYSMVNAATAAVLQVGGADRVRAEPAGVGIPHIPGTTGTVGLLIGLAANYAGGSSTSGLAVAVPSGAPYWPFEVHKAGVGLFGVDQNGAIARAAGITSSGTITFSGLAGGATRLATLSASGALGAGAVYDGPWLPSSALPSIPRGDLYYRTATNKFEDGSSVYIGSGSFTLSGDDSRDFVVAAGAAGFTLPAPSAAVGKTFRIYNRGYSYNINPNGATLYFPGGTTTSNKTIPSTATRAEVFCDGVAWYMDHVS